MNLNTFVFQDKASLVLRAMLKEPTRKWVARDFVKECCVSIGLVSRVLRELRDRGFIKGKDRGRLAEAVLRNQEEIVKQWTNFYEVGKNYALVLYSEEKDILNRLHKYFEHKTEEHGAPFALTIHSGANLTTAYVREPRLYFYLNPTKFIDTTLKLRQALNLKELKEGGNIIIMKPYYKNSIFFGMQQIQGYPVVSNLQLYLDLFHFPQRGLEHAQMLARTLKEKGKYLG
jgi:hypothetical protein